MGDTAELTTASKEEAEWAVAISRQGLVGPGPRGLQGDGISGMGRVAHIAVIPTI